MKFKKGDKVRIVKPVDIEDDVVYYDSTSDMSSVWVDKMDGCIGHTFIIGDLCDDGWLGHGGWQFLEDWLEFVDNPVSSYDDAMSIV